MEYKTLTDLLDEIDKTVTTDRNLSVKAFGLLLLGRNFEEKLKESEVRDPTDFILRDPSLKLPDL